MKPEHLKWGKARQVGNTIVFVSHPCSSPRQALAAYKEAQRPEDPWKTGRKSVDKAFTAITDAVDLDDEKKGLLLENLHNVYNEVSGPWCPDKPKGEE